MEITYFGLLSLIGGFVIAFAISREKNDVSTFLKFYLWHTFFTIFYAFYSLSNPADALQYYTSDYVEFKLGTNFLRLLTANLRDLFQATYFDLFLLFQLCGFVGICLIYILIRELAREKFVGNLSRNTFLALMLPGIHFWTCSIGKDSLIFLGIVSFLYGICSLKNRLPMTIVGFTIVFMVRPHVALCLLVGLFLATLFSSSSSLLFKILNSSLVLSLLIIFFPVIANFAGLESVDGESVDDYLDKRQGYNLDGGSSVDISNYPFPLKFMTYLYRPLFFDSPNILGIVVSMENVILILLSFVLLKREFIYALLKSCNSFFLKFNLIYFLVCTSMLSQITANLGIAIRQKTMILPSLLIVIFVSGASMPDREKKRKIAYSNPK